MQFDKIIKDQYLITTLKIFNSWSINIVSRATVKLNDNVEALMQLDYQYCIQRWKRTKFKR